MYVTGIHTNFCVAATAMAAYERGYRCFVVRQACAAAGGEPSHEEGLACVERYLGPGEEECARMRVRRIKQRSAGVTCRRRRLLR